MARGLINQTTKQKFVEVTYELIKEKGLKDLRIRDIAERVGCTSPALYKHFETLDYLIMVASVKFLSDYMMELIELTESDRDSIEIDIAAWKAFNKYAFANPPIFLHLFWGDYSHLFEEAVLEYYQMFPAKPGEHRIAYFYSAAFNGSIREREFIWLRRAATEGFLNYDDAVYISKVNDYTVHCMLLEHKDDYTKPGVVDASIKECNEMIEKTFHTFLLKGYKNGIE